VAAACLPAVAAAEPAAAAPTCHRTTTLATQAYGPVPVPSAGTTPASTTCLIGRGATSSAVRRLQQNLNACHGASLTQDGVFGARTESALRAAQRAVGVADDGVYGPRTRDALRWWTGGRHADGSPICPRIIPPG
jgi:murein L,D-transpeptidase YcbB/YkuD